MTARFLSACSLRKKQVYPRPSWSLLAGHVCSPGPGLRRAGPRKCWKYTWEYWWCFISWSTRKPPRCPSLVIKAVFQGSASTGPACVTTAGSGISASTVREDSSKLVDSLREFTVQIVPVVLFLISLVIKGQNMQGLNFANDYYIFFSL